MSSNVVPLQPIPRLVPNNTRHTINDNQAQRRSNASAPDLRGYLNNRRAKSAPADDDEFGPRCFISAIRNERFPPGFKAPREVKSYNSNMNPATWIQDYAVAMNIQNASALLHVRYFPLILEGTARTWINNLPKNSIGS